MYEDFYGFSEQPFSLTPDPKYLYLTPTHSEAFSAMRSGVRERKGITVITGDVGTGKTTLIRALLMDLDEKVKTAYIFFTKFDFRDLLRSILYELDIPAKREDAFALLEKFYQYLSDRPPDEIVAIIIDEAQNLETDVIKDLLRLWARPNPRSQLVQTILAGQLELEAKLNSEGLRDFRERIAVRSRIIPLTPSQSRAYINHRLKIVGSTSAKVFQPEAVDRICDFAGGIPRVINMVCDAAFLIGYAKSKQKIDSKIVKEAITDLSYPERAQADRPGRVKPLSEPSEAPVESPPEHGHTETVSHAEPLTKDNQGESRLVPEPARADRPRRVKPLYGVLAGSMLVVFALGLFALFTWYRAPQREIQSQTGTETVKTPSIQEGGSRAKHTAKVAPVQARGAEVKDTTTVIAEKGSTLSLLAKKHYGSANPTTMDLILKANPQITDAHLIHINQKIALPPIADESFLIPGPNNTYKVLIGTFIKKPADNAFENQPSLRGKTIEIVSLRVSPRETWYRVLAGQFDTREEGLKSIQALRNKGLIPLPGASAQ